MAVAPTVALQATAARQQEVSRRIAVKVFLMKPTCSASSNSEDEKVAAKNVVCLKRQR